MLIEVYISSLKYVHTKHALTKSIIYMCPKRNHCIACRYLHNKRKWHIDENSAAKEVSKWKRQKAKSIYFAKKQQLWIKSSFNSLKIKDLYGSEGIQKKQPYSVVLRKTCSENMQQIYRRTPMSECEFNKLHFHIWVFSSV